MDRETELTEHDLIDAFVTQAKNTSLTYKARKPLYEQLRERQESQQVGLSKVRSRWNISTTDLCIGLTHSRVSQMGNARMAMASKLDGNVAQVRASHKIHWD